MRSRNAADAVAGSCAEALVQGPPVLTGRMLPQESSTRSSGSAKKGKKRLKRMSLQPDAPSTAAAPEEEEPSKVRIDIVTNGINQLVTIWLNKIVTNWLKQIVTIHLNHMVTI